MHCRKVDYSTLDKETDQFIGLLWKRKGKHHAATQKGCRQFPLVVGRHDDQGRRHLVGAFHHRAGWRDGKAAVAQRLQQSVRQIRFGLVDLIDQQYGALVGMPALRNLRFAATATIGFQLPGGSGPVECPPQGAGLHIADRSETSRRLSPGQSSKVCIGKARDSVEAPHQFVSFTSRIHHHRQQGSFSGHCGGLGKLALARAWVTLNKQWAPGRLGRTQRSYLLIIAGLVKSRVKANASLELDRHWVSDWTKLIKESGLAAPADSTLLKIKKQLLEVLGDAREPISK